jgi:hypothetical protein
MGVVAQIIASIYDDQGDLNPDFIGSAAGLMSKQRFTPMNYQLVYSGNVLTLYKDNATESSGAVYGTKLRWRDLVNLYGSDINVVNGISQVRLAFMHTTGASEIVGTVAYNPTDDTQLLFTPFAPTLPANTLDAVDAIIDPWTVTVDSSILSPAVGTRYLILNPIGYIGSESAVAWAGTAPDQHLIANANDIIVWNGSQWTVSFDSREVAVQYVSNLKTTIQYQWTGENWVKSYEGLYHAGDWSLVL